MDITSETTVGEVATKIPASMDVFERYNIDFCCGGQRLLTEVAAESGRSVGDLMAEITRAAEAEAEEDSVHLDWSLSAPDQLVDHVTQTHHRYLREHMPVIGMEMATVLRVHGENHPSLFELGRTYERLQFELSRHLDVEEADVFPLIRQFTAHREGGGVQTGAGPGDLDRGLARLEQEHDVAGELLHEIRRLTDEFTTPADACATYGRLFRRLRELEADVHRHVHLENNILIPALRDQIQN